MGEGLFSPVMERDLFQQALILLARQCPRATPARTFPGVTFFHEPGFKDHAPPDIGVTATAGPTSLPAAATLM